MRLPTRPPLRRLAWLAAPCVAVLAFAATPARAQDAPQASASPSPFVLGMRNDLESAAKHILERLTEHRFRLQRIDSAIRFFLSQGNSEKVRYLEHVRERESNAFQQTLDEYRRLLGDQDFERLITVLRDRITNEPVRPADPVTRRAPTARTDQLAAYRRFEAERARASQRAQIASRMKQQQAEQLRLRAAQARRAESQRPAFPTGTARGAPTFGGVPVRSAAPASSPYKRQRGRP